MNHEPCSSRAALSAARVTRSSRAPTPCSGRAPHFTFHVARLSLLLLAALSLFVLPLPTSANGNNQVIILTYLPEVSNFGSRSATGTAVVDLKTGEVAIQVANLTTLSDRRYTAWLTGPNLEAPVYVAALPDDGHLPTIVVTLPEQVYRYVLITAEEDATTEPPAKPSEDRALAGVFPNEAAVAPLPGIGAGGQTLAPEAEPPLDTLPVTGAILPDRWVAAGVLGMVLGGLVLLGWRKVR